MGDFEIFFWVIFSLLFHPYTTYPLSLLFLSHLFPKRKKISWNAEQNFFPKISVLISAYNEERFIRETIQSILSNGYPLDKLEILIGSDGSTDGTNAIIAELAEQYPQIQSFFFGRIGKPAVLNSLVSQSSGDILVFLDADALLCPQSLEKIIQHFANPSISAVDGSIILRDQLEQTYFHYEHIIKSLESKIGCLPSLTGMFYALRTKEFSAFPIDVLIAEDLYRALYLLSERKIVVHSNAATIVDLAPKDLWSDFRRRIRYSHGGINALKCLYAEKKSLSLLHWYLLLSHKLLRWLTFPLLVLLIIATLFLFNASVIYQFLFVGEIVLLLGAIIGGISYAARRIRIPVLYELFYVSLMYIGLFTGILKSFFPSSPHWIPPNRSI